MPIDLRLVRDGYVLLRTLTDPLDAAELMESFRYGAREILAPSSHTIHLILDATNLHKPPNNLLSIWRNAEKMALAHVGQIVIVSQSGFVKTMTSLVSHVTHLRPMTVSTLDEAFAIVDRLIAEEAGESSYNKQS